MTAETDWDSALTTNWEKSAAVLPARSPLMRADVAFEYLCRLGKATCASRTGSPRVRFATERGVTEVRPSAFPTYSDQSFDGYYSRVVREYDASSVLLYVRNVVPEGSLASEVDMVIAPLWVSGARWRHLELELYVGRYEWTTIGIHREPCGNIHQVLSGEKDIIVWGPQTLSPRSDRPDCALFGGSFEEATRAGFFEERRCKRLTARNGEAIYFPSEHWHVGVSRQLSVALDISLYGTSGGASAWS
jgi:hypothetical protein